MVEARCMKCKKNVEVKDGQQIIMKNGRPALTGLCSLCGTKVFKILKAVPAAEAVDSSLNTQAEAPAEEPKPEQPQ